MIREIRAMIIAAALLLAGGCWNGYNHSTNLGNVSIGQQMIDLQKALEQGAISQDEYARLKEGLMVLDGACEKGD